MKKIFYFQHAALDYVPTLVVGSYVDKRGNCYYVVDVTLDGLKLRLGFKNMSSVTDFINCNLK